MSLSVIVANFAAFAEIGSLQEGRHIGDDRKMIVTVVEIDLFCCKLGASVYICVEILS